MSKRTVVSVAASSFLATSALAQQQTWSVDGDLVSDQLGSSVAYVPDVDGDGVVDFLVGAPSGVWTNVGKAVLYSGATRTPIRTFEGTTVNDHFGGTAVDLGDVDGDSIRDFAIGAPWRPGHAGNSEGAIDVVSGASGVVLYTILPSNNNGEIGWNVDWLGDVDGDGVRDVIVVEYEITTFKDKVLLYSGRTGATIRSHSSSGLGFGEAAARAGDVDGDGVDDYMISDNSFPNHVYVYSGANGGLLRTFDDYYTSGLAPAGDVDLDGRPDLMLDGGGGATGAIHVVSSATGNLLYDLPIQNGVPWDAMSAGGDLDGDGRPELVALSSHQVFVFSGANGAELASYAVGTDAAGFGFHMIDATADVNGDGLVDVLVGDPYAANSSSESGEVDLVSGADGSRIATLQGESVTSHYAWGSTIVPDRDGDGWRDVAVVVPGGLVGMESSLIQLVSGQSGRELSRFRTASALGLENHGVVGVGDVNGDGVDDLAVACPGTATSPTSTVEIHSGADDSLITTLVLPGGAVPKELAAAKDLDGTPLLAVSKSNPNGMSVFDLTSGKVRITCRPGSVDPACVGDANHDGSVDWLLRDERNNGTVYVYRGSNAAKLWSFAGSSSDPVDFAAATGDLNGDGVDDVLVGNTSDNGSTGKVTVRSGHDGTKLFEITGPQSGAYFGSALAPLGDVNRDGVADFVVGARGYSSGNGALFVYSGRTLTPLHRLDLGTGKFTYDTATLANQRWQDDTRVDGDHVPDLVVGTPEFQQVEGSARWYRLDDLMLQVDPSNPQVGDIVTATASGGPAGNLAGLYLLDLSGVPLDYFFALGTFDTNGDFATNDTVPSSMQGLTLDVVGYGVGFDGKLADTETTAIAVQ